MRSTPKKLTLPKLEATRLNGSFNWPHKTCPLITEDLITGQTKRYHFTNKNSGQTFRLTLYKGDAMPGSVKKFEMELMDWERLLTLT